MGLCMVQMPFQNNATCNRTCVYKLVDNDYFNLEDSYIARARPAYIATDPSLAMVRACASHVYISHSVARIDLIAGLGEARADGPPSSVWPLI